MSYSRQRNSLPFKMDQEFNVIDILKERHEIPYHSRSFMWTENQHIKYVTTEIIEDYYRNNIHWLGFIILYTGGATPSISDGQHRMTICFLMILALSNILDNSEPIGWISKYGGKSLLNVEPSEEDNEILEQYGWSRFPNIQSIYDQDFEALGNLINGKEKPKNSDSKLYAAYDIILKIINKYLEPFPNKENECKNILQYLSRDVRVTRMNITDWQFAMKVFNSLNNIKVEVPQSYLLKNKFASALGQSFSSEIHNIFVEIEKMDYRKYEKNVHMLANLFGKRIIREHEYSQEINNIIPPDEEVSNILNRFRTIVDKSKVIFEFLKKNPFGQILETLTSGHEVYSLCLIPFGFLMLNKYNNTKVFEKEFEKFIRKLICYAIRADGICFNSLSFQEPLIKDIVNPILKDEKNYELSYKKLLENLQEWLGENKYSEPFINWITTKNFSKLHFSRRARPYYLYLIHATDTLETKLDHSTTDIDHIIAKKPNSTIPPLVNMDLRFNIGNFTPFVSKNVDDVKGNKSLGNKNFKNKVEFYKKSNLAMTRKVAEKYEESDFKDEQILERAREIAMQFDYETKKELGIN